MWPNQTKSLKVKHAVLRSGLLLNETREETFWKVVSRFARRGDEIDSDATNNYFRIYCSNPAGKHAMSCNQTFRSHTVFKTATREGWRSGALPTFKYSDPESEEEEGTAMIIADTWKWRRVRVDGVHGGLAGFRFFRNFSLEWRTTHWCLNIFATGDFIKTKWHASDSEVLLEGYFRTILQQCTLNSKVQFPNKSQEGYISWTFWDSKYWPRTVSRNITVQGGNEVQYEQVRFFRTEWQSNKFLHARK